MIPSVALEYTTGLKQVIMPDSVVKICYNAFSYCENLESVTMSEGLETIGYRAFSGCTNLQSITIPADVTSSNDGYIYSGAWFYGCDNLKNIAISYGVTTIPDSAFANINSYINIHVPETIDDIGENILSNTPNVIIISEEKSNIIPYAINNENDIIITKEITSYDHFVYGGTDYYSNSNEITGYVPFEVKYEVKDGVDITDKQLTIRIPSNSELIQSTLKVNGIIATEFELDEQLLTIPVEDESGVITFCVKPMEYTTLLSYAKMDFKENGESKTEIIGVVNCSVPDISIKADSVTNDGTVTVEGIAPPSSSIELYIAETHVGTAQSVKSGNYKTEISIPSPENYNKYTITARTDKDGETVDANATVMYQDAAPVLKSFDMYYGDHGGVQKYELSNQSSKPIVWFNPAYGFKFEVSFENHENVDKVYIVSTRNNQKKYMDAVWNEEKQCFVAEGRFEDTSSNYVPGEITVEYTKKRVSVPITDTIDAESLAEHMNSAVKDCTTEVITNTDTEYQAKISVADELSDLIGDEVNMVVTKLDREYSDIPISDLMSSADDFYSYFIEENGKNYVLNLDLTDKETLNMVVHDIAENKQINYALDFLDNSAPGDVSTALKISEVLDQIGFVTGTIADMYDIESRDEELRDMIYASGMDAEEQAIALNKADELKTDRQVFLLLTTAITVATMGAAGPPAMVFGLLFGAVTASSSFFWDMRMANIMTGGTSYSCKWAIDPSGYVYEAVTSNRIAGVTAIAYWIAPEYIDENGIGDESKAVLWDASEYAQMNPLITDINGAYAWDVPEGLWQVRFEKDGYETQESDWLPVPPPQTEVNIGLVSKTAPTVENAVLRPDSLTLTFDKYMKPETVRDVEIGGHTYTLEYDTSETAADGTIYAKTYIFKLNDEIADGESVSVSVSSAESYAGVTMADYNENVVCSNAEDSSYVIEITDEMFNEETGEITAAFVNLSDSYQTFDAICAVYDANGAIVGIQSLPVVALEAGASTSKVFGFDVDWAAYKIFVWDSLDTMQPLAATR